MSGVVDAAIGLFLSGYRSYLRVFAASFLAERLSVSTPVRRTGFEFNADITGRRMVAGDVVELILSRSGGGQLPTWTPGAHFDLILPSGRIRQYSLCGDLADRSRYRIGVRRITDGGASAEAQELAVGDRVRIRGPRNAFGMVRARSFLFVAAGIGITPILPMVHHADKSSAEWRLVYLGQSRERMPFLDELARYRNRVLIWPSRDHGRPSAEDVLALGRGEDGRLPSAVYLCGPAALIDAVRMLCRSIEPNACIFSERFAPLPQYSGVPFTATLARSGRRIVVGPNESLLSALRRTVPDVRYSCQRGFCGTCRVRVLSGVVEHHGVSQTSSADNCESMLACLSRGRGSLVLDI